MAAKLLCRGKTYQIPVLISPEDFEWASGRGNWFLTHGTKMDGKSYAVRSEKGRLVFLHKEILLRAEGPASSPLYVIGDHLNGNSLDNRRDNLRWATPGMNARNRFGFAVLQRELKF